MPNRMLRDWTMSDKINSISMQAERFFTRLIMKVDDHGCFYADPRVLKANLFPLLLDTVREADLLRWTAECQKAGLIVLYESASKKYIQILDFRQRLDRAKSKYPLPNATDLPAVVNDYPPEVGTRKEVELERKDTPPGVGEPAASPPDPKEIFKGIECKKKPLYDFIAAYKPDFIEPYVALWNLFAGERGKAQITKVSDARAKKFKTRIREKSFDFLRILTKAGAAGDFLSASKWFTWDWIMNSEANYLKVLEGNYDREQGAKAKASSKSEPARLEKEQLQLNFLFEQFLEDKITVISIDPADYNFLKHCRLIDFSEERSALIREQATGYMREKEIEITAEKELRFMKCFGVLEYFRQLQAEGRQTIFHLDKPVAHAHT